MRSVTTAFKAAAASSTLRPALFMEGLFDSGSLRLWTGYGTITWNSYDWTGAGTFISIKDIEERSTIEAVGTTLSLSGLPSEVLSLALNESYQGRTINIYLGFFDSTGSLISDLDTIFSGLADVMTIEEGGETCTLSMTVENRFIDLQRARERYYTHQDQQIKYSGDLGLNYVSTLQDRVVVWGHS